VTQDVGFILVFVAIGGAVVVAAGWLQSRSYKSYLDRVAAENAKLVESQRLTQALLERQTASLDRIAAAIENRGEA